MKNSFKDQLEKEGIINVRGHLYKRITKEQIASRNIVYLAMNRSNGLTLRNYNSRNKYVVIVSVIDETHIVGSLLINTDPNIENTQIGDQQYPLSTNDYPDALDYKSWLDCSLLFEIEISQIETGYHAGYINQRDWGYIVETLKNSPTISNKKKRKYNILEL
ncbi:hypothetical protein [Phocaeicola paurosaccharolyticus]|uniref:hypothetical protein n=1 Tax=Phocaeicola paurosaccharolyticus TaxID=732242 RepID=UPI002FE3A647